MHASFVMRMTRIVFTCLVSITQPALSAVRISENVQSAGQKYKILLESIKPDYSNSFAFIIHFIYFLILNQSQILTSLFIYIKFRNALTYLISVLFFF